MKKEFIKKTAMLWIALSSFIAPAFADEEITPLVPMDTTFINTIVIPIQLQIIGQTHPIPHAPSRPVTNLMV